MTVPCLEPAAQMFVLMAKADGVGSIIRCPLQCVMILVQVLLGCFGTLAYYVPHEFNLALVKFTERPRLAAAVDKA